MVWYAVNACVIDSLLQGMPSKGNWHAVAVSACGSARAKAADGPACKCDSKGDAAGDGWRGGGRRVRGAAPGQRGPCGRLHALANRLPHDAAGAGAPGAHCVLMANTLNISFHCWSPACKVMK